MFFLIGLTISTSVAFGPTHRFRDEPDNYLAPDEGGHSIIVLRRDFQNSGTLIVTSHNPEAIRRFSESNTLCLARRSHLEPTIRTCAEDLRSRGRFEGGFVDALLRGDVEP